MATRDENRKWLSGQVDDQTHNAAMCVSSETGKHITALVEEGIHLMISHYAQTSKSSAVRIHAAHTDDKSRQNQIGQLKQLIISYQGDPNEDMLDRIKDLCDLAGVSMERLVEDLNKMPHLAEVLKGNDSISKAELWLVENLLPDKPTAVKTIQDKATKVGFKWHVIKDARDRLKANTGTEILSMKQGKMWFWNLQLPSNNPN